MHDVSDSIIAQSIELGHEKPDHIMYVYVLVVSLFLTFCADSSKESQLMAYPTMILEDTNGANFTSWKKYFSP